MELKDIVRNYVLPVVLVACGAFGGYIFGLDKGLKEAEETYKPLKDGQAELIRVQGEGLDLQSRVIEMTAHPEKFTQEEIDFVKQRFNALYSQIEASQKKLGEIR